MIRIKTYNFRQALEKFVYKVILLVIIILMTAFSIIIAYLMKKEFENSISSNEKYNQNIKLSKSMVMSNILSSELSIFANVNGPSYIENSNHDNDIQKNVPIITLEEISKFDYELPDKYETRVLESGKIQVGNTKISNYSKLELNLDELSIPASLKLNSHTSFLIYHTHATESYTIENQEIENYRTTNSEYNMISIGKALVKELEKRSFISLHDTILHDYPNYNGSYAHSLDTVVKYMKSKNFDFIFDIHRDAISSDLTYGPVCEINGERVAQLMFVIGTDANGLKHDKWMENLKYAITIQNRANEMYPGLFRDINLSKSRYNQHVSTGAFIIEVGTTGNTLEEAKNSMKYLANVIESFK